MIDIIRLACVSKTALHHTIKAPLHLLCATNVSYCDRPVNGRYVLTPEVSRGAQIYRYPGFHKVFYKVLDVDV